MTDTGDRLPLRDILACTAYLEADFDWQIEHNGDGPAAFRERIRGVVAIAFTPLRLTWKTSKKVVDAVAAIVTNDDWTYASHIIVSDIYLGRVGDLSIRYRAPDPGPGSSNDTAFQPASSNSSVAASGLQNETLAVRPSSPYPYTIPGTQITILCAGFGSALDPAAVLVILLDAEIAVSGMVMLYGPLALVDHVNPWRSGNVVLDVHPDARLRWFDLLTAIQGAGEFMSTFGSFAFTFEIRHQGRRSLGVGHFRLRTH